MAKKIKKYKVSTLDEYIKIIEILDAENYYFRGENNAFHERIANAYRESQNAFIGIQEYPFEEMLDLYYREVSYKLPDICKQNFLAFAQHHKLPTNLIDITSSALIALYFACTETNKNGFVYCFSKANMLNITQIIENYGYMKISRILLQRDFQPLKNLALAFKEYFNENKDELNNYTKILLKYFKKEFSDTEFNKTILIDLLSKNFHNFDEVFCINLGKDITLYVLLLVEYLISIKDKQDVFKIEVLPNFLYNPVLDFERGRNQQGAFIFQIYCSNIDSLYNCPANIRQIIKHNAEIEIQNQKQILISLDKIGYNKKFIFKDFDSIAEYIKDKYQEKLKSLKIKNSGF